MFNPVGRPDRAAPVQSESTGGASAVKKSNAPASKDCLSSLAKKVPFIRWAVDLFSRLIHWVKYHVLFLIFDETEEALNKSIKQIDKYHDLFYSLATAETEAGRNTLKTAFKKLSSDVQKLLKETLLDVLRADSPALSEEQLQAQFKQVLIDPFIKFDHDLPEEEQKIAPFGRAIGQASLDLAKRK